MVRGPMSPQSGFFPRALNSEFPNLEAYIYFSVGDMKFLITYSESSFKQNSEYTIWKEGRIQASYHKFKKWLPLV